MSRGSAGEYQADERAGVCQMTPKDPRGSPRLLWESFTLANPPWSSHLNLSYPGDAPLPAQPFGGLSTEELKLLNCSVGEDS